MSSSSVTVYDRTKVLFATALSTSLLWYIYWTIMAPVENDISDLVNWFFFMKLHLSRMYNIYSVFAFIHNWCPLVVITSFVVTRSFGLQRHMLLTSQLIYIVIIAYNIFLFFYILIVGKKIRDLFLLTFPLRMVHPIGTWLSFFLAFHHLFASNIIFFMIYWILNCYFNLQHRYQEVSSKLRGLFYPSLYGTLKRFVLIFLVPFLLSLLVNWSMSKGCSPCIGSAHSFPAIPDKPALIAHRGCGYSAPENTVAAFNEAASWKEIIGLETDVQVSAEGELFLLHDPNLVRTTDADVKCSGVTFESNASLLNYSGDGSGCVLSGLNVGQWFVKEKNGSFPKDHLRLFSSQTLPTFHDFLSIAKQENKIVIFDAYEPPVGHPHHMTYLNKTMNAILSSGLPLSKVWWLPKQNRPWVFARYPEMIQTTKTKDTPFEDFLTQRIQKINDDWSTPLETLRKYQAANLSINMFFVDSVFMYRYAWCVGVQSVTTDNCQELRAVGRNTLYEACQYWHRSQSPNKSQRMFGIGAILVQLFLFLVWEFLKISRHRQSLTTR